MNIFLFLGTQQNKFTEEIKKSNPRQKCRRISTKQKVLWYLQPSVAAENTQIHGFIFILLNFIIFILFLFTFTLILIKLNINLI